MNLTLAIASLLVLAIFFLRQRMIYRRLLTVEEMSRVYDLILMEFAKQKVYVNRDYKELLKIHKAICINPEYLDIQILILSKIAAERDGKLRKETSWYRKTRDSLPSEIVSLLGEFDQHSDVLIRMSFFKYSFLFFVARGFFSIALKKGLKQVRRVFQNEKRFIFENEIAIFRYNMRQPFDNNLSAA